MPLDFQRARPLLQTGNLTKLFVEELGWEHCRKKLTLRAGDADHAFTAIAEKRGFTAWLCACAAGKLPDHTTRLKLDRKLSETSFEHLIVFATHDYAQQSWVWVRREPGRPLSARTHEFNRAQPGDSLLQKLQVLYVSLEEEEAGLSVTMVAERARAAFDIERVTKAFYRDFDTHRKAFLKFIDGIDEVADCEWYASVMLNRLMFVYFIQRKGFLDGDHAYLRNRLDRCQKEQGKDKFYSFYRYFLLRLFHEGFGRRRKDRAPDLEKLLGNIPYLNGGLFDVHELEKPDRYGKDIQIADKAFERVFDYFDQYQWHLDERPLRQDNEINPDVLGYIFEKYINQKQMGAYYTKEDITEYISKNCVIPFLFDAARAKCKVAFENPNGPTVWDLLRENPDRYIYPAVRHGTDEKLPPEIAAGLDATKPNLIERRKAWNKPAPGEYGLPTEIWREVVARRRRYHEVFCRLSGGPRSVVAEYAADATERVPPIQDINDFITFNLDLRQFAQDVIQNCEGPDLLMAFWQAITTITVLDPTGGSGAFIFAALNILEPLYEACLDRMEAFLAEWGEAGKKLHPNYHKKFTEVLARVDAHPNRRYFVLKSIILNNLYAVDIMEEAVEICKLRLFLKLASQVEPDAGKDNLGIEPLPDIDFNIRAGNTLVGYATYDEVKKAVTGSLDFDNAMEKISVKAADLQQTFDKFRQLQTEGDGSVPAADKLELQKRLKALEDELNRYLAGEYGVNVKDKVAYARWLKSHQPFHWFIHFYGILARGGFDVIIGNPPFVEYAKIRAEYEVRDYKTESCGNLYVFVIERATKLAGGASRSGFIIPMSGMSSRRTQEFRELLSHSASVLHVSSYAGDAHPSILFEGVRLRLSIVICAHAKTRQPLTLYTTIFQRWYSAERPLLYPRITLWPARSIPLWSIFLRLGGEQAPAVWGKLLAAGNSGLLTSQLGIGATVFYQEAAQYFVKVSERLPYFAKNGKVGAPPHGRFINCTKDQAPALMAVLSSSLFYLWYHGVSDCYHVSDAVVQAFPCPRSVISDSKLRRIGKRLEDELHDRAKVVKIATTTGDTIAYAAFNCQESKPIMNEIDVVLAGHYGFTAEELDFILNYDIKYRLGRDAGEEGED